jgi:hypothetical protein
MCLRNHTCADSSGHAVEGVILQPLASWECGFDSRGVHGWLYLKKCCMLLEVSAANRSLFQRNPTQRGVSECDREASIMRKPWPTEVIEPWKTPIIH